MKWDDDMKALWEGWKSVYVFSPLSFLEINLGFLTFNFTYFKAQSENIFFQYTGISWPGYWQQEDTSQGSPGPPHLLASAPSSASPRIVGFWHGAERCGLFLSLTSSTLWLSFGRPEDPPHSPCSHEQLSLPSFPHACPGVFRHYHLIDLHLGNLQLGQCTFMHILVIVDMVGEDVGHVISRNQLILLSTSKVSEYKENAFVGVLIAESISMLSSTDPVSTSPKKQRMVLWFQTTLHPQIPQDL